MQLYKTQTGNYLAATIASILMPAMAIANPAHAHESDSGNHNQSDQTNQTSEQTTDHNIHNIHNVSNNNSGKAEIKDTEDRLVGIATFHDTKSGLEVAIEAQNLAPGAHAIHIHEIGQCTAPSFKSAGGHFNPSDRSTHADSNKHDQNDHEMHSNNNLDDHDHGAAGDLPNLVIDADGDW
jgi:Cu-Zn family superoxide dismutase